MGGSVDLTDHIVGCVGDEEVAGRVQRNRVRIIQRGAGGLAPIAAIAITPVSGDGGHDVGDDVDLADPIVALVCNDEVSDRVEYDARRSIQRSGRGLSPVAAKGGVPVSRKGGNYPGGRVDLADPAVAEVDDESSRAPNATPRGELSAAAVACPVSPL